ncbi:MAG: STAS domain-containing protein [Planctomycetia bacterium]|nr:STAS domain-containing protein [Planctomycetia bacterium]
MEQVLVDHREGTALQLTLTGRIDSNTSEEIGTQIAGFLEDAKFVELDFSQVSFISSAGLRMILAIDKQLRGRQGKLEILDPTESVREVFTITGLGKMIPLLLKEPSIDNPVRVNCGILAMSYIFDDLGIAYDFTRLSVASKILLNEITFGSLYRIASVEEIIPLINEFCTEKVICEHEFFQSPEELHAKLGAAFAAGKRAIFPFYITKELGLLTESSQASLEMRWGHWGALLRMDDQGRIFGKQSCPIPEGGRDYLDGASAGDLFKSNQLLQRIKVDWGKMKKCPIAVSKKQLGLIARCGRDRCIILSDEKFTCVFTCELSGSLFLISREA